MELKLDFQCPASMKPHMDAIFRGEYDVPYHRPHPVVLDVGANIGGFAIWAIGRWPGCKIHCYEPVPGNFAVLKTNVELLRPYAPGQIEINNFAIGHPSRSSMFVGKNNCGEASFFDLGEQEPASSIEVVTYGADILEPAQILKMDTEGCEIEILSGLPEIQFEAVMIEYHSELNRREIDNMLRDYVLVGGHARCIDRGVVKYLHKKVIDR